MKLYGVKIDGTLVILFGGILIIVMFLMASKKKSCSRDMMDTYPDNMDYSDDKLSSDISPAQSSGSPAPSPCSFDTQYTSVTNTPSQITGHPPTNPSDLLPSDKNTAFSSLNPTDNTAPSLLDAGFHHGIDTVSSSLRNANLQIRSEPSNPIKQVSVWNQTTIIPDTMRPTLEIGGCPYN